MRGYLKKLTAPKTARAADESPAPKADATVSALRAAHGEGLRVLPALRRCHGDVDGASGGGVEPRSRRETGGHGQSPSSTRRCASVAAVAYTPVLRPARWRWKPARRFWPTRNAVPVTPSAPRSVPTQAITLSVGGVLQTLRVPLVRENFETNVPGVFIVGELSGMGLIKTAVNEGKLVVDHLRQRLKTDSGE